MFLSSQISVAGSYTKKMFCDVKVSGKNKRLYSLNFWHWLL